MADGALLLTKIDPPATAPGARFPRRSGRPAARRPAPAAQPGRRAGRLGQDEPAGRVAHRRGRGGSRVGLARRGRQRSGALLGLRVGCAAHGGRRVPAGFEAAVAAPGHLGRRRRAAAARQRPGHRRAPARARARRLPPDLRARRSTRACASCSSTFRALAPGHRDADRAAGGHLAAARAGELDEIASEQLRFSDAEAAALLNDTLRLALAPESSRGSARAPRAGPPGSTSRGSRCATGPAPRAPEDLGYDRHLVDYLGDEVVSAQDDEARAFLVETCVLDRFCAPLCDAVRGRDGSSSG